MHSEKPWVFLLAALITAIAGIIAAIITVDAKRDRERLEAAIAEREAEIKRFEEHAKNREPQRPTDINSPSQAAQEVDRGSQPASTNPLERVTIDGTTTRSPEAPLVEKEPPPAAIGTYRGSSFSFDLLGCQRSGDLVQCSLTVTNLTGESKGLNLCGEGELVDDGGRELRTRVRFSGGNSCGILRLPPNLPRALEMTARANTDSHKVNIVFGETVAFRDIGIDPF